MELYLIQDDDRPVYVMAFNLSSAIRKWRILISAENDIDIEDVAEPKGVSFVAPKNEVITAEWDGKSLL